MKNEAGFTIIEMLLVIAISAVVLGGSAMALTLTMSRTTPTSDHMTVVRQLQNAGYWVSSDTLRAQTVMGDDSATAETEFLTLWWVEDWESSNTARAAYILAGAEGELKELQRHYQLYDADDSPIGNETVTLIAQYIDDTNSSWSQNGEAWTLEITASVGGETESRTYTVKPRPF